MIELVNNSIVNKDVRDVLDNRAIDWNYFKNSTVYITGATGGIGSFLVSCFAKADEEKNLNIKILAGVRNKEKAKTLFKGILKHSTLKLVINDITEDIKYRGKVDFIIHCANNTSSRSFVEKPIETMNIAIDGTKKVLEFAKQKAVKSMVYLSSMEVYGEITENTPLKEDMVGKVELMNARSSYPIGKRTAETICFLNAKELGTPVKIARLAQIIGANVDYNDSRVYAQFARSIVEKKDIVLNTTGETIRSYCYITDAVTGILTLLQKGENGEAYNIANKEATVKIRDIAEKLCNKHPNTNLVFDIKETTAFFKETIWALDTTKIESLGWQATTSIDQMYARLIESFYKQLNNKKVNYQTQKLTPYQKIFSITDHSLTHLQLHILGLRLKFPKSKYNKYKKKDVIPNKIVFSNYLGNGYGCNPKYICDELLKRNKNYDIVWLVQKDKVNEEDFPKEVRLVEYESEEAIKELATAKIWVDNYHKIKHLKMGLKKHKDTIYIQTWHGSLGIKKIEKNVDLLTKHKKWLDLATKNSQITDYWISNSSFETEIYKDSFWDVKNIKEFGHPRNDVFFQDSMQDIRKKVFEKYNIPLDKKLIIYLPSFREDESTIYYDIDYKKQLDILNKKLGADCIFAIRLHPRVKKYSSILTENNKNIIDVNQHSDVQEILVAGDVLISDYSSCMFDFALSQKPVFIYANDLESYTKERGFAYPIESTPFPIATTNDELSKAIENFDYEKYKRELNKFLKDKGCIEDGNASTRIVDLIESI